MKPTHRLKMKSRDKAVKDTAEVGVAWLNADGSLSLQLNTGVTLSWRDKDTHIMTLFPTKEVAQPPI